jgi:hypothetical protein
MSHISDSWYGLKHLFFQFQQNGTEAIGQLDRHQWALLMVATVGFGVLCMRGYGSRRMR